MEKKNMLDLMLERAEQSAQDKLKVLSIKSDVLGDIEIKIPPLKKLMEYIDESNSTETTYEDMLINAQMVYDCSDILRKNYSRLSEAYDEKDPATLTLKIFEAAEAVGEVNDIAQKIIEKAGLMRQTVKNS